MAHSHGWNMHENNSCHIQAKQLCLLLFPFCPLEAENSKTVWEGRATKCKKPGSLNHHMESLLLARNTYLELL